MATVTEIMPPKATSAFRFEFRVGTGDFGQFTGHVRDGDPESLRPNQPRLVVNGLFRNGEIIARNGQIKLNADPLDVDVSAEVLLLEDFQFSQPFKLWILARGCPNLSPTSGFSISNFDTEQEPQYQRFVYYDDSGLNYISITKYSEQIIIGVGSLLAYMYQIKTPFGSETLAISGPISETPIKDLSDLGQISALGEEYNGFLPIGIDAGAGSSSVQFFNGVSIQEDLDGLPIPQGFGLWRDKLIVGFLPAANQIRVRSIGDPPGTWATVNGTGATGMSRSGGQSYKDKFYFADGAENIWVYDGSTLSLARNIVGATFMDIDPDPTGTYLYYSYQHSNTAFVGRFDNASWIDQHKNLTTQFPTLRGSRMLQWYRSDLYVIAIDSGGEFKLFRSDRTNTSGANDWVAASLPVSISTTNSPVIMRAL